MMKSKNSYVKKQLLLTSFNKNYQGTSLDSMQNNIYDNLKILLDSRKREIKYSGNLTQIKNSVLVFGLPDFTQMAFSNKNAQQDFCQTIKNTIKIFEPRLNSIEITILPNDKGVERILKIRIDATIYLTNQAASFQLEVK